MGNNDSKLNGRQSGAVRTSNEPANIQRQNTVNRKPQPGSVAATLSQSYVSHTQSTSTVSSLSPRDTNFNPLNVSSNPSNMPLTPPESKSFSYQKSSLSGRGEGKTSPVGVNVKPTCEMQDIGKSENPGSVTGCDVNKNFNDERSLPISQTNKEQRVSVADQIKLDSHKKSLPVVQRDVRHVLDFEKPINRFEKVPSGNPFLFVESNQSIGCVAAAYCSAFKNTPESEIGVRNLKSSLPSKDPEYTIKESPSSKDLYKSSEITQKSPKKNMAFFENPSCSNEKYSPVKEDTFKAAGYSKQKRDLSEMFTEENVFGNKEETSLLCFETKNSSIDDKLFTNTSEMGLNGERNTEHMNIQKLQDRQRRNYLSKKVGIKNHCLKPNTSTALKHVQKIADSLNTFNHSIVTKNTRDVNAACKELFLVPGAAEKKGLSNIIPARKFTLADCLFHMRNLDIKDKDMVSLLQHSLIYNVQEVNNFVTALTSCPILNKEIIAEIEILLENLTSLVSNQCQSSSPIRPDEVKSNEDTCVVVSKNTNSTPFSAQHTNCEQLVPLLSGTSLQYNLKTVPQAKKEKIEVDSPKQEIKTVKNSSETLLVLSNSPNAEKSNVPEEQNVIPLNKFKTLLDQLPDDLVMEKNNIFLRRTFLYCKICEKSLTFEISNLTEHLRGKSHKKGGEKNPLEDETEVIATPPEQKDVPEKKSISPENKDISQKHLPLPSKYEGVLDIVLSSCTKGLLLNVSLYICRPCDFLTNSEEDANNHVVDVNHKKQVPEHAKWYFCNSCSINIYGTDIHIKEHDLTSQHIKVIKLKSGNTQNSASEEVDRVSLHSSSSDLSQKGCKKLKPHEILLAIAKESKDRNTGAAIGMYCQICNKYLVYKKESSENHFSSELHAKNLSRRWKRNNYEGKITYCSICQVDIFGDQSVLDEHATLLPHVEMANSMVNSSVLENSGPESDGTYELSNEDGPHFDLMKSVIKKHLTNEPKKGFWGFYCHICEAFCLNNNDWKNHLSTSSHFNRINSSECIGKKMLHDCLVCNIQLICHGKIFTLHEESLAHQIVSRRVEKNNASPVDKEDEYCTEDETSDGSESSDDDDSMTNGSDSTSTSSSNKNAKNDRMQQKRKIIPKCVQITNLPVNIGTKDVFEVFRSCGYISKCIVNEALHSCTVRFNTNEAAEKALNLKNYADALHIKGTKVTVAPVYGPRKRRTKKVAVLSADVAAMLQSAESVKRLMNTLQKEMVDEALQRDQRSNQIKRDLAQAIPDCKVHLFGSQVTGLATKQSDFDVYIDYDNLSYFKDLPQMVQAHVIKKLLALFTKPRSPFRVTESVLEARVPILRVVHLQSNIPCDISCRSGLSVENSQLVRLYVCSDHRVKWLVIMVKWWMRANNLLDRSIFTSYAVTWLVLFFLMRLPKPILCSVNHLRKPCPEEHIYSIAGWDCRFTREIRKCFTTANKQSNYDLLLNFFNFYGTFRFNSIVLCPLTATMIPRKHFEVLRVPPPYITYVKKVSSMQKPEILRTNTPICLQDPFDLAHNITKGVGYGDLNKFQALCLSSARICANLERP